MIIDNKVMNIVINGRTIADDIYDQDYPLKRISRSGFSGIEKTGSATGQDVKYFSKYNSYGWRCDEFIQEHGKKSHILFAGCSEALGEGSVVEESWPHMLYTKLSKELNTSGFFCLGVSGMGWVDIFSTISQYIDHFGNPEYLFINLPNSERYISYIEDYMSYGFSKGGAYRYSVMGKDNKFIPNSTKIIGETNFIPNDISQISLDLYIRLFEKVCELKNIKLFWGSWDNRVTAINDRVTNKSKYVVNTFADASEIRDIKIKNKDLSLSKPDGHRGTVFHYAWSEKLYNAYKEREENEK
jgi:hypothetical protein